MLLLALHLPLAFAQDPPAWVASEARYAVHVPASGDPTVEATYRFLPVHHGWFDGILVGQALIVQGVSGPVTPTEDGLALTLPPGTAPVTVTFRGTLPASAQGELDLPVLPAAIQRLEVDAPGFDVHDNAVDGYLHGADQIQIQLTPHQALTPSPPSALVSAEVGTAFWEDEGVLAIRSEVHLRARRGSVASTTLSVAGLDEVEVTGANVARSSREGDLITVEAQAPVKGSWVLAISGRATPGGPVPWPQPTDVQRTDAWWVLGRSSETELVPVSAPEGVPARAAPVWVQGLAETAPLAFFHGTTAPELRADRFEPLMGPETVIEQADFRVGLNEDGRQLLRATYLVRNERKQYLHFTPPPGYTPVAARVGSRPIAVLSDGQGGIYVSLERSLETVQGLVSFPLEVTWLATGPAWDKRKGSLTLALPGVDAPIQSAAWTVHLPRGYRSLDRAELSTSPGVSSISTEESSKREEVQSTLDNAIQAYRKNDFDTAQVWVDHAKAIDASDANVNRMQSNLDVLAGKDNSGGDEVMSRRVKDLANAKTDNTRNEQSDAYKEAKKAVASGDVSKAKEKLSEVISSSNTLQAVEQKESVEQSDLRQQAEQMLASLPAEDTGSFGGLAAGETTTTPTSTTTTGAGDEDEDRDGVSDEDTPEPVETPPPEPKPEVVAESTPAAANENTYVLDGVNTSDSTSVEFKGNVNYDAEEDVATVATHGRAGHRSERASKGAKTPAPMGAPAASEPVTTAPPPSVDEPVDKSVVEDGKRADNKPAAHEAAPARAPLDVHPTVLTLAMPEGGALLTHSAALLDSGEQPTLTLHYRSGDPR